MTQIELQNLITSFFKVENGRISVKDLNVEESFIEINAKGDIAKFAGIKINRGDSYPLNLVWEEETKTFSFTFGPELAHLQYKNPPIKVLKIDKQNDTKNLEDNDVVIVNAKNTVLYLEKNYTKRLTIKVIEGNVRTFEREGGKPVFDLPVGTHTLINYEDEWLDIS